MKLIKNKNMLIMVVDEDLNKCYTVDVNTGIMYGVSGKPVAKIGSQYRRTIRNYANANDPLVFRYIKNCMDCDRHFNPVLLSTLDKFDSLNDPELSNKAFKLMGYLGEGVSAGRLIETIGKYDFKKLIAFLCEQPENIGIYEIQDRFESAVFQSQMGCSQLTSAEIKYLVQNLDKPTAEEVHLYEYYLINQQMRVLQMRREIALYLNWCRDLQVEPRKNNNPIREFAETKKRWDMLKEEIDMRKFSANYAKHPKAWEFEYGDFIVRIPTKGEDLITEGARMHHCVGSYVDRVAEGECSICFIRHKDTPEIPYITCEIRPDGRIGQYYLAHDYRISSAEDKAFKLAYQEYLLSIWQN